MSNSSKIDLKNLSDKELLDLAQSLQILDEKKRYSLQEFLWDSYTKEGYEKHVDFFRAGLKYNQRALIAGNRVGKTRTANTELCYHLNGKYPEGWVGRKFNHPVKVWSVGVTHDTTRDILQKYLLGGRFDIGSGMIPKEDIIRVTSKQGVSDAIQDVYVKHYTNGIEDGISELGFKSYIQGVEAFMGTEQHVIHLDEEPTNTKIYDECLTRTMTVNGMIICTFTPLNGLSDVVMKFIPGGRFPEGGLGEVLGESK